MDLYYNYSYDYYKPQNLKINNSEEFICLIFILFDFILILI